MAGKTPKGKVIVENDIEKNREDGNWNRVIELADLLIKPKPPLHSFLVGEAKLESYLENNPPLEKNISKARIGLAEAKHYLSEAITEQGDKCGVALDGHLLLGKVQYALGDYEGALKHFDEADLQGLTEKSLAPRSIRIIAESFAIKGLCAEKMPPQTTARNARLEWVEQIKHCYETASDLGLLYLQQQDKQHSLNVNAVVSTATTGSHSPQPSSHSATHLSVLIETAILRTPIFLIEHGQLTDAVTFYRNMLSAVEAPGAHVLRLTLCRQLAEILLRGMVGNAYVPPADNKKTQTTPWKPNKYTGLNIFCPRNEYEEIILLLLISEAMAAKNAVLSQSPEFKDARSRAFTNATVVYDLLTVALVRWKQFSLLQESFDRAMKFSSDEAHIWMQHALCLDAIGQYSRAFDMMKEVIRLKSNEVQPKLIAARIAYHHLNKIDEGLELSQKALNCDISNPHLLSRCYLYVGIGAHSKAALPLVKSARDKYHRLAHDSFLKAHQLDTNDHLAKYYLGLHAAFQYQISEAVIHVKAALNLYPEHLPSLHLMILLLTAQKQMKEASELLDFALQEYPDSISLHFLKIHLELHLQNNETALMIGKRMLSLWKTTSSSQISSDHSDSRFLPVEFSDRESNSMHATQTFSIAKLDQALSDVGASSISSSMRRPTSGHNTWTMQHKIWLLLAEIYLEQDQLAAATSCLQEAINIYSNSHYIMYMKGRIHEYKNEFNEARLAYGGAFSLNPCHLKSLQHLGLMCHYTGNQRLAEKILRYAAKLDPWSSQTWYNLGKVLESAGEAQSATDCLATALHTETISPVLPYNTIPITFE